MTAFEMYLFTRIDKIIVVSGVALSLSAFAAVTSGIYLFAVHCDRYSSDSEKAHSRLACLITVPIFLISFLAWTLIPSQKELAAIMVVPKILSSENVDNLTKTGANGTDIVNLATEYTKEILEQRVKK